MHSGNLVEGFKLAFLCFCGKVAVGIHKQRVLTYLATNHNNSISSIWRGGQVATMHSIQNQELAIHVCINDVHRQELAIHTPSILTRILVVDKNNPESEMRRQGLAIHIPCIWSRIRSRQKQVACNSIQRWSIKNSNVSLTNTLWRGHWGGANVSFWWFFAIPGLGWSCMPTTYRIYRLLKRTT